MKPLQIALVVAVAGVSAVGGGLFVKWQSNRNAARPTAVTASVPVTRTPAVPVAAGEPSAHAPGQQAAATPAATQPAPHSTKPVAKRAAKVMPPPEAKPSPMVHPVHSRSSEHGVSKPQLIAQNRPVAGTAAAGPVAGAGQSAPEARPADAPQPSETKPETPAAEPAVQGQPPAETQVTEPAPSAQQAVVEAPPPPEQRRVTLQAGMLIPARTVEALSSDRNQAGDTFTATLDESLVVDGWVIAERGAHLEGKIVRVDRARKMQAPADLEIELTQLNTSDGQRVQIETDPFQKRGDSSRRQDAAKIGAAAVIGAAIGAIAGGGKGAGIGAAAGGAVGAGDVMLTHGKPAEVKSETRINFRLRNTITLTERTGRA